MAYTSFTIFLLIGAALGLRFRFLILIPAICLTIICIAGGGIAQADRIGTMILTIVLVSTALQIGYLFGVVTRGAIAWLRVPERKTVAVGRAGLR
jgi:hypothetical protein